MSSSVWEKSLAMIIILVISQIGGFIFLIFEGFQFPQKFHKYIKEIKPLCKSVKIPNLLGMILFGCLARNLGVDVVDHYSETWGSFIKMICLSIILLRAGMELQLKGQGIAIFIMAVVPSLFEAIAAMLLFYLVFDLPFMLAVAASYIIAPISPSIVVPSMIKLQFEGYGYNKKIPINIAASATFDVIISITLFGVFSAIALNPIREDKEEIYMVFIKIAYQLVAGIASGIVLGYLCYFLDKLKLIAKFIISLTITLGIVIMFHFIGFSQLRYIFVITYGYVLSMVWKDAKPNLILKIFWNYLTVFLFGNVGASIVISDIRTGDLLNSGILIVACILVRFIVTFFTFNKQEYTRKEKIFASIGWIPKAAVQAALGSFIKDEAKDNNDKEYEDYGLKILTTSIFQIAITVPIGLILIFTFVDKLLSKDEIVPQEVLSSPDNKTNKENDQINEQQQIDQSIEQNKLQIENIQLFENSPNNNINYNNGQNFSQVENNQKKNQVN